MSWFFCPQELIADVYYHLVHNLRVQVSVKEVYDRIGYYLFVYEIPVHQLKMLIETISYEKRKLQTSEKYYLEYGLKEIDIKEQIKELPKERKSLDSIISYYYKR